MDTSSVTKYASGAARIFGEGLRRSTVAHFARKVRGTNIAAAKHEPKNQQGHASEHWPYSLRVRGPHFASKVSYNASPHPPPQKACNPSLQSPHRESLSLYQVIDLRPRAALPSAASRVTFGREQHDPRPQIDNV